MNFYSFKFARFFRKFLIKMTNTEVFFYENPNAHSENKSLDNSDSIDYIFNKTVIDILSNLTSKDYKTSI